MNQQQEKSNIWVTWDTDHFITTGEWRVEYKGTLSEIFDEIVKEHKEQEYKCKKCTKYAFCRECSEGMDYH